VEEEILRHSPILTGRVAARSEHGLEKVIAEVREAMGCKWQNPVRKIDHRSR
jgi:hypothetical protein